MEIWKDVCGFENFYQVSNKGRVKSLDRTVVNKNGVVSRLKGSVLKAQISGSKYLFVNFGKNKPKQIHRLVAIAFLSRPEGKTQVNHIDGDKFNNDVANLEWVSCSENHKHSYKSLDRKLHPKSKIVCLEKDGFKIKFYGCNAASKYLGVVAGSIASAAKTKHKCKGWSITYETCKIERFREFEMAKLSG